MLDTPTGANSLGRKKRLLRNKLLLFIIIATFLPVVFADVQVVWRLTQMRIDQAESLQAFRLEAYSNLENTLEEDAKLYLAEITRQGSRRMNQFLDNIALESRTLATLMTTMCTHPARYKKQAVPDHALSGAGAEPRLLYAAGKLSESLREEVELALNIQDYLMTLPARYPALTIASVASRNGFTLEIDNYRQAGPAVEKISGYDARTRPWYMQAQKHDDQIFTDLYESYYSRSKSISTAVPYYAGGEFAGVVRLGFSLENINKQISEIKLAENGFAFLLTPDGRVAISPHAEGDLRSIPTGGGESLLASGNASLRGMAERMVQGEHGVAQVRINGEECLVAFEPLASSSWVFGLALPMSEALRASQEITNSLTQLVRRNSENIDTEWRSALVFLLFLHVLTLLAAIAVARFAAARLTRPLEILMAWATALGQGKLEQPLHLHTGDEIEQLAVTLNQMRQDLVVHMDELLESRAAQARLLAELDLAREIQQTLLPRLPQSGFPGVDVAAVMLPARLVGGDFYDYFYLNNDHLALVIGDISDKGMPAALYMSMVKTMLKAHSFFEASPANILEQVNNVLCRENDSGMFATVFMGVLSLRDGRFVYANAGHCPPLFSPDGVHHDFLPVKPALVLGIEPDVAYQNQEIVLEQGAILIMYTDGVTESLDARENLYTELRFRDFLNSGSPGAASAQAIVNAILGEVETFSQGIEQSDDLTLLVVRRELGDEWLLLPAITDKLEELQNFIGRKLLAARCPDDMATQIQICCEEAFMNIATHAYHDSGVQPTTAGRLLRPAYEEVLVEVRTAPGQVELEFQDRGIPFDPTAPRKNTSLAQNPDHVGGQGIVLMHALMDEISYTHANGTNRLLLRKRWKP